MHTKMLYTIWLCVSVTGMMLGASSPFRTSDESAASLHAYIPVKEQAKLQQALDLVRAKKVKLNEQDEDGNTYLHLAVLHMDDRCTIQLVNALIRHGASVHTLNNAGKSPRDLAMALKCRLFEDKVMHERDPLHGEPRTIEKLNSQITALQMLFEVIPKERPNSKTIKYPFYLKKSTPAVPLRPRGLARSAGPCSSAPLSAPQAQA